VGGKLHLWAGIAQPGFEVQWGIVNGRRLIFHHIEQIEAIITIEIPLHLQERWRQQPGQKNDFDDTAGFADFRFLV
jgi:hypothetical protein